MRMFFVQLRIAGPSAFANWEQLRIWSDVWNTAAGPEFHVAQRMAGELVGSLSSGE
jgi:hypothetical protein